MDIYEGSAPYVKNEEIQNAVCLDVLFAVGKGEDEKKARLYYVDHRNLFVIAVDGYETADRFEIPEDSIYPVQVVTDIEHIQKYNEKYFNKKLVESRDMFVEYNSSDYASFKSDFDLDDIESIKKYGRYLEKDKNGHSVYYLKYLDIFVFLTPDEASAVLLQCNDLRKKYNIPYQDERFANLIN